MKNHNSEYGLSYYKLFSLIFCFTIIYCGKAQPGNVSSTLKKQDIVIASQYGVSSSNTNNAAALQKALLACRNKQNPVLVLPGGRIDVWQQGAVAKELYVSNSTEDDTLPKTKYIALPIEKLNNLTIDGKNTLIVLHNKMVSFAIINSKNITIKNLAFDYERPTMNELTVTKVDNNAVETTIHPDTKYKIANGKIEFYGEGWKSKSFHTIVFSPSDSTMRYSSFSAFLKSRATELEPNKIKFEGDFSNTRLKQGEVLTVRDTYRDNCGGFIWLSRNVLLQNMNMYYMHGLGIVSQFSENLTYKNIKVAPQKKSGRIISSFADCFHFSGCKGKILLDGCFTSGSHDDPVNVHGTHLKITGISSQKLTVRFMHHQTYGFSAFFAGDSIAFIHPQTLQPLGYAKLKKATLISKREMEIETEKPLPGFVQDGICIENITCTPEVTIRNCRFERTNTRGVLITTRRKVLIENNYFFKTGMHAILIGNDASSWYESGPVYNVVIRNNMFDACGYNQGNDGYAIAIAPENHKYVENFYVHKSIVIENNIFKLFAPAILTAKSVDGLKFYNNMIESTAASIDKTPVIKMESCNNIRIKNNQFKNSSPAVIRLNNMQSSNLTTDLKTTTE